MDNPFFDVYRTGLRNAADMVAEQARWLREFSEVRTLDELFALQTRFAMSFWTGFARSAERQLAANSALRSVHDLAASMQSSAQERAA